MARGAPEVSADRSTDRSTGRSENGSENLSADPPAFPAGEVEATVDGFAAAARGLAEAARAAGLAVPAFRSPPRLPGAVRTLRRYPGGTVVSVRLRGRPLAAVVADMVEGVIVANRLTGEAALRARTVLAEWVAELLRVGPGPSGVPSEQARVVERQTRAA